MAIIKNRRENVLINEQPPEIPTKKMIDDLNKYKLSYLTSPTADLYAYINDADGKEKLLKASQNETAGVGTIVLRNTVGNIRVAEPNGTAHATPKSYVDEHLAGLILPAIPSESGTYNLQLTVDAGAGTVAFSWVSAT